MILEVNGTQYSGFLEARAILRLDSLANSFSFQATSEDGLPMPFLGGEKCSVNIEGETILTGFIEIMDVSGNSKAHDIVIQGRDKTADLLDSMVGSLSDIRPPISLKSIIEKVLEHIDSDVDVIDEVSPAIFETAEDLAAPDPGQEAFKFIESLARKRQVLLTSNGDGDIVIAQSSGIETEAVLQNHIESDANNVLTYAVSYDSTGRYNKYHVLSQLNPLPLVEAGTTSHSAIVDQSASVTDPEIRAGRKHVVVAEAMSSKNKGRDRAAWESNIRIARSKVYSATVHGNKGSDDELWRVNRLVKVEDQFCSINTMMLINSIEFSLSSDGGRQTSLSLVNKNAYTLELSEPTSAEMGLGLSKETPVDEEPVDPFAPWWMTGGGKKLPAAKPKAPVPDFEPWWMKGKGRL